MKNETPTTQQEQEVEQIANAQTDVATAAPAKKKVKFFTAGNMAVMAILTAISYVLYLLPKIIPIFNLPFFPPWLDIQISDLPALLGGFAIGPWASVIIIVLKCALKMPLTSTSCVGELADIVVGIAFVLPASLLYKKFKNRKSSALGMLLGTFCATGIAVLANWLVLIPFYAMQFGNMDYDKGMSIIVGAVSTLYEGVTVDSFYKYYLTLGVIPFNVMRCVICAVITFFVYKPLSKALHWEIKSKRKAAAEVTDTPQDGENIVADTQTVSDSSETAQTATTDEQGDTSQQ